VFTLNRSEGDYSINFIVWAPDSQQFALVRSLSSASVGEIWITDIGEQNKLLVPMEMYAGYLNWSPDGKTILFTSEYGERVTPTRPVNLWTVESETGITKQLTENIFVAGGTPNWSPDGNWVAYTGKPLLESETASYELWLISRDGDELIRLTNDVDNDLYPNWVSEITINFQKQGSGLWSISLQNGRLTQIHQNNNANSRIQYVSLR
jgi:Tol biopolymer transport system component